MIALGVPIGVVMIVAALVAGPAMGWRIEPGLVMGGAPSLSMLVSRALVDRILRRRGLSRWRTTVEVHARVFDSTARVGSGGMETVEARIAREWVVLALVGMPLMSLCLFAMTLVLKEGWLWWTLIGMTIFFMVCWVENVFDYGTPLAWVDADGVTGYPSRRGLRRRFVPWADVSRCEVETIHDASSRLLLLRPILKGRHGETLMELYLTYAPMAEQDRIVKAITARFSETGGAVEPWTT